MTPTQADLARAAVDLGLLGAEEALDSLREGGDLVARWKEELRLDVAEVQALLDHASALAAPLPEDTQDSAMPRPVQAPQKRYSVAEELLGEGGMGRVEAVRDHEMARTIARKRLRAGASKERFLTEARITARLEHPGIVPIYEIGEDPDGTPWYTMRRVAGRTLGDALERCATLDDRLKLLRHVTEVARVLAFAHSQGVVHCDVKPSNILIGPLGETLLIDWGVARELSGPGTGPAGGTPAYMSPEQSRGDAVDPRSDVWSLGVVLHQLLSAREPSVGDMSRTPRGIDPGVPPELDALCRRCLRPDKHHRLGTAEALLDELTSWQEGRRLHSYRYSAWEVLAHFARHNPLSTGALAALLVVSVGAGFGLWRSQNAAQVEAAKANHALAEALSEKAARANDGGDHLGAAVFAAGALELVDDDPELRVRSLSIVWAALEQRRAIFDRVVSVPAPDEGLGGARALAWSPDGGTLAMVGADGLLRLMGAHTGEYEVPPMGRHRGDLAFVDQAVVWASGGDAGRIDLRTGVNHTLASPGPVGAIAVAAEGAVALAVRDAGRPRVQLGEAALWPEGDFVEDLVFDDASGDLLLLQRGTTVRRISRTSETVWTAALPEGASALAIGDDRVFVVSRSLPVLWVLDLGGGALLREEALDSAALDVVLSSDAIVLGGEDGTTTLLDRSTLVVVERLTGPAGGAAFLATSESALATGGTVDRVQIWALGAPARVASEISGATGLSATGSLATVAGDTLYVLDPDTLETVRTQPLEGAPRSIAMHPQVPLAAITDARGGLRVVGLEGEPIAERSPPDDRVTPHAAWTPSWSPDGAWLAAPGFDRDVWLLELETGAWTRLGEHAEHVWATAFRPDGRAVASVGFGGEVRVWSLDGGVTDRVGHHGLVSAAAWSDAHLATGEGSGTVRIWSDPPRTLDHHSGWITALAWSPDGATLVSGSDDGTAAVWDADTGRLLRVIPAEGDVTGARFVGDALLLLEGGRIIRHATARPPAVDTSRLLDEAESAAGGRLEGIDLVARGDDPSVP